MLTVGARGCKVPPTLMELSGYCSFLALVVCAIFRCLRKIAHRKTSPRKTSTALPPTRTLTIRLLLPVWSLLWSRRCSRDARTKIRLARFISRPCSIKTCSSGLATPWATIQAAVHPAAEPVAGSSPL